MIQILITVMKKKKKEKYMVIIGCFEKKGGDH